MPTKLQEQLRQRATLHQLHGEVRSAAFLAYRKHRHDAGVGQPRDGIDLAPEALARARKEQIIGAHELEGNFATQRKLLGAEDDSHAASAQTFQWQEVAQLTWQFALALWDPDEPQIAQAIKTLAQLGGPIRMGGTSPFESSELPLCRFTQAFTQQSLQSVGPFLEHFAGFAARHGAPNIAPAWACLGLQFLPRMETEPNPFFENFRRASQGDREAVGGLLALHLPAIEGFVRRHAGELLQAHESPSDVAQSVCRDVLERLRDGRVQFQGEAPFKSWLYRAVVMKMMTKQRFWQAQARDPAQVQAHDPAQSQASEARFVDSATPSQDAVVHEEMERLAAALAQLPERFRTIIALHHIERLAHHEIAHKLGIQEAHSRVLLGRALARLATICAPPPGS